MAAIDMSVPHCFGLLAAVEAAVDLFVYGMLLSVPTGAVVVLNMAGEQEVLAEIRFVDPAFLASSSLYLCSGGIGWLCRTANLLRSLSAL